QTVVVLGVDDVDHGVDHERDDGQDRQVPQHASSLGAQGGRRGTYPGWVPFVTYSVLRLGLVAATIAVLWLVGVRHWLALAGFGAVVRAAHATARAGRP